MKARVVLRGGSRGRQNQTAMRLLLDLFQGNRVQFAGADADICRSFTELGQQVSPFRVIRGRVVYVASLILVIRGQVSSVQTGQLDRPSLSLGVLVLACRLLKESAIRGEGFIEAVLIDFIGLASELVEEGVGVLFIGLSHLIYLLLQKPHCSQREKH